VLAIVALIGHWQVARACGCFHDPPTVATPVVQAGERILFSVDNGQVTAHIQIAYQGQDASQFGWTLPLPSLPTLEVGSEDVFNALGKTTGPLFQVNTVSSCQALPSGGGGGCACEHFDLAGHAAGPQPMTPSSPNPVVVTGSVGPYDYTVLDASSQQPLVDWLNTHGFALPAASNSALANYVGPGRYFMTLSLMPGKSAGDIKPIIVHYASDYPMIPITLTAATSAPVLPITVWVLGPSRAIPRNYFHSVLNDAALDWVNQVSNYAQLVTRAARETQNGQMFITEFSGPSSAAADGIPSQYASLFQQQPHLTRLFTMLDSANMTTDPVFAFNPDLPDVPANHDSTLTIDCAQAGTLRTEEGLFVPYQGGRLSIPLMPANLRVEALREAGPPQVLVDNTAMIRAALAGVPGAGNGSDAGLGMRDRRRSTPPGGVLLAMIPLLFGLRRIWRRR
jgi:hypothetical protein